MKPDRSELRNRCGAASSLVKQHPVHLGVRNAQVSHRDKGTGVFEPFGQDFETDSLLDSLDVFEDLEPEKDSFFWFDFVAAKNRYDHDSQQHHTGSHKCNRDHIRDSINRTSFKQLA